MFKQLSIYPYSFVFIHFIVYNNLKKKIQYVLKISIFKY